MAHIINSDNSVPDTEVQHRNLREDSYDLFRPNRQINSTGQNQLSNWVDDNTTDSSPDSTQPITPEIQNLSKTNPDTTTPNISETMTTTDNRSDSLHPTQ